jgi:hypothetical protein
VRGAAARAFLGWVDRVVASAQLQAALMLVLMKWNTARMRAAFETWLQLLADATRARHQLERCQSRMSQRLMYASFSAWVDAVECLRSARSAALQTLRRLQLVRLCAAFTAWRHTAELRYHRLHHLATHVASRWRRAHTAAAVNRWRAFANECKGVRNKMLTFTKRLGNVAVSAAWTRWTSTTHKVGLCTLNQVDP